jgi:hypothetical protein
MLEELLDYIVAKNILHQLNRIRLNLSKHLIFFVAVSSLQLLLNEPRSMLVPGKFYYMAVDVLCDVLTSPVVLDRVVVAYPQLKTLVGFGA